MIVASQTETALTLISHCQLVVRMLNSILLSHSPKKCCKSKAFSFSQDFPAFKTVMLPCCWRKKVLGGMTLTEPLKFCCLLEVTRYSLRRLIIAKTSQIRTKASSFDPDKILLLVRRVMNTL